MDGKVNITRVISGPIDEVFDAFVNPEKLGWHHPDGYHSKTTVNGEKSYEINMIGDKIGGKNGIISGEFTAFDRPNKLVFTWSWNWQPGMSPTTVEVNFKKIDENKTQVSLTHSGFADEATAHQHEVGWGMAFNNLNKQLEGGE